MKRKEKPREKHHKGVTSERALSVFSVSSTTNIVTPAGQPGAVAQQRGIMVSCQQTAISFAGANCTASQPE
jgi:hypothetical protein